MDAQERLDFLERFFRVACDMNAVDSFFYTSSGSVFFIAEQTKQLQIFANCNDLFDWACADAEEVTPENIHILEQAWADIKPMVEEWRNGFKTKWLPPEKEPDYIDTTHAVELFACRIRKMRPQGPCYQSIPPVVAVLFDSAGPDRGSKRPYKGTCGRGGPTPDDATPWTCPKCVNKPTDRLLELDRKTDMLAGSES